ncbi:hypothetical protein Celal_2176 [Cellulophaga algicola DSM 14237]|uniref:Uncharacterized protein n=1 Tax=Cellulophaga algicola (strain DSM 14237 / IC166 / ACAM 630) TaxID=688270 RepID=E6X5S8_CELAD|nr:MULTISPECIES: hypothetical protein [Cellulophaga]ADV49470.1 hypothetical protein Celal_2176 [Cellulophaga algicola DSM 14237]
MKDFIELSLGSFMISHGYDEHNKEIEEHIKVNGFAKKLVAVNRIKSLSERYILTDYVDGRWIYWEYEEAYTAVKEKLESL